ncbi:MAG: MBL fold metallo-hydrolase [Deltaproteobacteria bacterium]|nr:MBL fold metallo-hydrolase [Deltaproteobacteria bacterium]
MLTTHRAGPYTVRGVSVGGVYTSLQVPELDVLFDVGAPLRTLTGAGTLALSHGHADHAGSLAAFLGIRALHGQHKPLRVVMPAEIVDDVRGALTAMSALQRWPLEIEAIGMQPGDEIALKGDLRLRAFKTYHPVPSLGYAVVRRVSKLKPEFAHLPGAEIGARRKAGEPLFDELTHVELVYATDTLVQVLDREPALAEARVLILECTFLDDRKSRDAARAGCHIHLDELIDRAELITNPHVVLMHFSQLYRPDEIRPILAQRLPPDLMARVIPFVPDGKYWPG